MNSFVKLFFKSYRLYVLVGKSMRLSYCHAVREVEDLNPVPGTVVG